jgi:hypothetical protein
MSRVNSQRENGRKERKTASDRAFGGQQLNTEKFFISSGFSRESLAGETVFTVGRLDAEDSNSRYLMRRNRLARTASRAAFKLAVLNSRY